MAAVTVVVPVYNGAEFLGAALDSALAQTLGDVRIVVVDDGSTDDTPALLDRYGARITVIRQRRRGVSAARNRGLAEAVGAYVALLDADDIWEPSFLELAVARLAAAGERTVGVFAGSEYMDRDGRPLPDTRRILRGSIGLRDLLRGCVFPVDTVVLRRAAVRAAGGFDEAQRATEDWDLWLRLALAGGTFLALERCLCRYRVHAGGWSRDPLRLRTGALQAIEKLFSSLEVPADLRASKPAAVAQAFLSASIQLYALRRPDEGARELCAAVRAWPDVLLDDETYYGVICAEEPAEGRGTPRGFDLPRGARHLLAGLEHCFGAGGAVSNPDLQRRAYGHAYRALARLAYGQRAMADVRRYASCALRAHRALWLDWATIGPLIKSFAGAAVVDALARVRRALAA